VLGVELHQQRRRKILGYLFCNTDLLNPFQTRVLIGAEEYCSSHGYCLLILRLQYSVHSLWRDIPLPPLLQRSRDVGGFILAGMNFPNLLELLNSKRIPFAVLGDNVAGQWSAEKYDCVSNDLHQASYDVTKHLISLGHRHIWFIGNTHLPWFDSYLCGYERAMRENSLPILLRRVESVDQFEIGYLGTKGILREVCSVTALFPGPDQAARGAYRALREIGLQVPQDVSVVACNDTEGAFLDPPLTTVREFAKEVGSTLASLVIDRIETPGSPPRQVIVPTQLIRRESSAPPREPSIAARNRT
jgi:LacI family transcriptional regulator